MDWLYILLWVIVLVNFLVAIQNQWIGHIGALHPGTETGFTGYRSLIQIQCDLVYAPHGMQTMRIVLLDWNLCSVPHAARIRIKAVWRQSGLWIRIPDPHRIRIQGPVWRAALLLPK